MRILLAYKSHPEGAGDPYTSLLPIGLCYLNGVIAQAGYECSVANFSRWDWKQVASYLTEVSPRIFGISQFTHNRFESFQLAARAKEINPSCFVVFGGPHASHRYREILLQSEDVDAVVLGEGEETFRELAEKIASGGKEALFSIAGLALRRGGEVVVTGDRPPIPDLDDLPIPAACIGQSVGTDVHRQLEFITTSRGCPAACRFCSSPAFWRRHVRFRSPRSIIDEIRFIRDKYGLIYFSFRDDTFTAERERVIELCRLLVREKVYIMWNCQSRVNTIDEEMLFWMKRAGCECIQVGIESGSLRTLRFLGKGIDLGKAVTAARAIRRAGINLSVYLITGVPGEDEEDVASTMKLIDSIQPNDGQVSPLAYYPGTSLYRDGVASGSVPADLFEKNHTAALTVRSDTFTGKYTKMLMRTLEQVGRKSRFKAADFVQQKKAVGYCHATNILAGEYYEGQGQWERAEKEYREIIERDPRNPWGWLALGELQGELGEIAEAESAFKELTRVLPSHAPAYAALGDIARLSGDVRLAARHYEQALTINPADITALEGLAASGKRQKK